MNDDFVVWTEPSHIVYRGLLDSVCRHLIMRCVNGRRGCLASERTTGSWTNFRSALRLIRAFATFGTTAGCSRRPPHTICSFIHWFIPWPVCCGFTSMHLLTANHWNIHENVTANRAVKHQPVISFVYPPFHATACTVVIHSFGSSDSKIVKCDARLSATQFYGLLLHSWI